MRSKKGFCYCAKQMLVTASALIALPLHAQPWIVGEAASVESGELLYQELHYRSDALALLSDRVEYVAPSGELLVEKSLNGARSFITPEVEQNDLRSGTRFSVNDNGDSLEVRYQRAGQSLVSKRIEKEERLVVDAGFDPYVRANWEALSTGEAIRAEFFVPARLDTVRISIRQTDAEQCAAISSSALCLVVRPAGILRLVGWLIDPLYLAYEQDSQRLLMYRGISNLLDENGEPQNVLIRYQYANPAG
tara:strand:- start:105 stop:851 length:747 start_codon:yes stop_codon:yes gene_type:complete